MLRSTGLRLALCLFVASTLARGAAAQNLLSNPDFDTNVDGWSTGSVEFIEIDWSASDVDGDPGSGSLEMTTATTAFASQCVPVEAGETYELSGAVAPLAAPGADVEFSLELFFRGGADCSGPPAGSESLVAPSATGVWHPLVGAFEAPATAQSAEVRLRSAWTAGQQVARFDALYVPEPVAGSAALTALAALAGAGRRRRNASSRHAL